MFRGGSENQSSSSSGVGDIRPPAERGLSGEVKVGAAALPAYAPALRKSSAGSAQLHLGSSVSSSHGEDSGVALPLGREIDRLGRGHRSVGSELGGTTANMLEEAAVLAVPQILGVRDGASCCSAITPFRVPLGSNQGDLYCRRVKDASLVRSRPHAILGEGTLSLEGGGVPRP